MTDALARSNAMKGFKWDFSQNLPAKSSNSNSTDSNVDVTLVPAVRGRLACMVRGSLPFSFEHDRVILAEEMLRSHGWQVDDTTVPDCRGIKEDDLRDLVGEMQAVQSCSVVLWSVLVVVGPRLSGMFAGAA